MRKIKMKYWKRPVEKKEELEKVENRTLDQMVEKYGSFFPEESENAAAEYGFIDGFHQAKAIIIQFLNKKTLGYNDTYFFKMRDIEALGEPEKISDEPMTEKDRVAKWDWSKNDS